jgi:hypothetical protein
MPGLDPGIHGCLPLNKTWMAGTSPAMTDYTRTWLSTVESPAGS